MFLLISVTLVMFYGAALLALGISVRVFVSNRRFNRRGYAGSQRYNNYFSAILNTTLEGILMIISALAIVSGLFLVILELVNSR